MIIDYVIYLMLFLFILIYPGFILAFIIVALIVVSLYIFSYYFFFRQFKIIRELIEGGD